MSINMCMQNPKLYLPSVEIIQVNSLSDIIEGQQMQRIWVVPYCKFHKLHLPSHCTSAEHIFYVQTGYKVK